MHNLFYQVQVKPDALHSVVTVYTVVFLLSLTGVLRYPMNICCCCCCCIDKKKYKYQWSLDSHPHGDETGQMTDINSASLKLSKVAELFFVVCYVLHLCYSLYFVFSSYIVPVLNF